MSETCVSSTRHRILSPHIFPLILSIFFLISLCLIHLFSHFALLHIFLQFQYCISNNLLPISDSVSFFFHDTIFLNIPFFLFSTIYYPLSLSFNNSFPLCFHFSSPIFHFSSSAPLQHVYTPTGVYFPNVYIKSLTLGQK